MSNSLDLLRMLEPPVRPGQSGGPARSTQRLPIEQQSFDALLREVQSDSGEGELLSAEADESAGGAGKPSANVLSPLSDLDAISNASLRELIVRNHRTDQASG